MLHTLATLAVALRGMPRDAPILVQMPGGLRQVMLVSATHVRERDGVLEGGPEGGSGGRYAIVLHVEEPGRAGSGQPGACPDGEIPDPSSF